MPQNKQKRPHNTNATPSRTLHDFFNPKSIAQIPSTSARKPKTNTSSRKGHGKVPARAFVEEDIIVIDSDSDDDLEIVAFTPSGKRRKLSPKNSDVPPTRLLSKDKTAGSIHGLPHSKENSALNKFDYGYHAPLTFGEPFLLSSSSPPKEHNRNSTPSFGNLFSSEPGDPHDGFHQISGPTFGQPFLLAPADSESSGKTFTPKNVVVMSTKGSQMSSLTFGQPFLLASASTELTLGQSEEETAISPKDDVIVDIDLTLDDWEAGDDEVPPEFNENDETQETPTELDTMSAIIEEIDEWSNEPSLIEDDSQVHFVGQEPQASTSKPCSSQNTYNPLSSRAVKPGCLGTIGGNAFSFLMSSVKENDAWKEAAVAEDRTFRPVKANGGRRKAPFYKVLQGMPVAVDAFKYGAIPGITAYFLTHAHSDHYTNLSSSWKNGPIYCSEGTANLIVHMLSVDRKWVYPLPMDISTVIPNTNGVTVTLIEANHCPGSCLFFFEGPQSVNAGDSNFKSSFVGSSRIFRYLHCGDFRASPQHVLHPAVRGKPIDHVYLDTTYLDPKYTFPPQPLVISACAELVKRIVNHQDTHEMAPTMLSWIAPAKVKGKEKEKERLKPLIVVGTYSIGKERIVKAIAHAVNSKVYCDARKAAILRCQADAELDALLTSDPKEAFVHLVPLSTIATDRLKIYLDRFQGTYDRVIGFRPTGWTYTQAAGTDQLPSISTILSKISQQNYTYADLQLSGKSTTTLQLYPVPYSEHSSFHELTCFAMSFSWVKMIATVNVGSESSRGKMAKWLAKWEAERKKRGKDMIVPHRHSDYW